MLKLRFSQPSHKQYMDGKVSVCKYDCQIIDNQTKDIVSEFTATGTAKCSPNDTVNPEFGKKLADSRAKLTAYKKALSRYPQFAIDELAEAVQQATNLLDFWASLHYLKNKEVDHISDLCNEV